MVRAPDNPAQVQVSKTDFAGPLVLAPAATSEVIAAASAPNTVAKVSPSFKVVSHPEETPAPSPPKDSIAVPAYSPHP